MIRLHWVACLLASRGARRRTARSMVEPVFIDACPAIPSPGNVSYAIRGSIPMRNRFPTHPSPFLFSSSLFLSHSLAQVPPLPIREEPLLPCCATTTARGEYDMSPSSFCHELYSDTVVEGRSGVSPGTTGRQHSGRTAVLDGILSVITAVKSVANSKGSASSQRRTNLFPIDCQFLLLHG